MRTRNATESAPVRTGAERHAMTILEYPAVVSALGMLPVRQREVIVLRFYSDLSEAQIAAVMGISRTAVKNHTARAVASLRAVLDDGHQ